MARPTVLVALWLLAVPLAARAAACPWTRPTPGWNHYYNGRLGGSDTVRVVLTFHGCRASGSWFDSLTFADFTVSGSLQPGGAAILTLRNRAGRRIATLVGSFGLKYLGLKGTVSGSDGYAGQRVDLKLDRIWNRNDAYVDASVGIADPAEFNRATLEFWRAVRAHDVKTVARCIRYPLRVDIYTTGHSPRSLMVSSAAMLERHYDEIFNAIRLKEILGHLPRHLVFGYYAGTVRLGGDAALFDSQGKVIALP